MSTSLSIKGKTSGGDGITTTINYVNPNATNEQLQSLASAFNNLTTNTISDVTRIDKNSLTESSKLSRNITFIDASTRQTLTTINAADISVGVPADESEFGLGITYAGIADSDTIYIKFTTDYNSENMLSTTSTLFYAASGGNPAYFAMYMAKADSTGTVDVSEITVYLPETDTYAAATATITIE